MAMYEGRGTIKPASIIVPAWNGATWISNCLRSIEPQRHPDDEIIVVDNGSTDGTPELVARDFPRVHLVRLDRNRGFAGGVNRGLEAARGDALILINQDVVLREGSLDALRRRLDESGPAIVGCKLLYPDGKTIQHAGGIIRYPRAEPDHRGYQQIDVGQWDTVTQVDYVTGAVFAFDRTVLGAIGRFDEEFYPAYYEEVDFCCRARAAGFPVIYEPAAVAIHHETQSSDLRSTAYHRATQRGRLRFVLKSYTTEQLKSDFFPAEREYVQSVSATFARQVLASTYLNALLSAPSLSQRERLPRLPNAEPSWFHERVGEVIANLSELRQLALQLPQKGEADMGDQQIPVLREHDFRSNMPVVGPLIQLARRGLYRLTAQWAVRVAVEQQNRINQMIAQRLEEYDARLIALDSDLTHLSRSLAEMAVQVRHLAEQVQPRSAEATGQPYPPVPPRQ
jgi:GT2 family glycosyltransferase